MTDLQASVVAIFILHASVIGIYMHIELDQHSRYVVIHDATYFMNNQSQNLIEVEWNTYVFIHIYVFI